MFSNIYMNQNLEKMETKHQIIKKYQGNVSQINEYVWRIVK